jgi:hypothetical protein
VNGNSGSRLKGNAKKRQRDASVPTKRPPASPAKVATGDDVVKSHKQSGPSLDFGKVPLQCNGLALSLFAVAGLMLNMHTFLFGESSASFNSTSFTVVWLVSCACVALAVLNQCLYWTKIAVAPEKTWTTDFKSSTQVAGQVHALNLANGSIVISRLVAFWPGPKLVSSLLAWYIVRLALVAQLLYMGRFLFLCHRERARRSVFWFAPCVSMATAAAVGGAVGLASELVVLGAWSGIVWLLCLLPPVFWRCITNPEEANNATVAFVMAPAGYATIAWHTAQKNLKRTDPVVAQWLGPDVVGDVLFAVCIVGVIATLYCSIKRREALRSTWFTSAFAAYTFPSASNANAALLHAMVRPHALITAYALLLFAAAITIVFAVNMFHALHLAKMLGLYSSPASSTSVKCNVPTDEYKQKAS